MSTIEQTYDINGVNEIILEGYGDVTIEQGDSEGMTIRTESEMMDKLKTEVVDGKLVLGFKSKLEGFFWLHHPRIEYHITVRSLNRLAMSGAGTMRANSLKTQNMRLDMSGAGKINLGSVLAGTVAAQISGAGEVTVENLQTGKMSFSLPGTGKAVLGGAAPTLEAKISGSGKLEASQFVVDTARVSISGVGSAEVYVNKSLEGSISGMGSIRYGGQPSVQSHTSGLGKIQAA